MINTVRSRGNDTRHTMPGDLIRVIWWIKWGMQSDVVCMCAGVKKYVGGVNDQDHSIITIVGDVAAVRDVVTVFKVNRS